MSNFYFHFVTLELLVVCWCGVSMERKLKGPSSPPSCSVDRSTIKLLPLTLTPTFTTADLIHGLQICCASTDTQAADSVAATDTQAADLLRVN